eukprot:7386710-Prymnesium_polylepis.1
MKTAHASLIKSTFDQSLPCSASANFSNFKLTRHDGNLSGQSLRKYIRAIRRAFVARSNADAINASLGSVDVMSMRPACI